VVERDLGRLVLAIVLGLAFLLTVVAALVVAIWGDDASRARVKEALTALLPTETLLLGAAVIWYFAGQ
jgi:F0F1-type ATP synthase assembly protein I